MPITFTVDSPRRAVLATARGIVSSTEVLDYLQAKARLGAAAFDELFDARQVALDLSLADLTIIADAVREHLGDAASGKTAVVTDSPFIYGLAKSYATLTGQSSSEFQVFQVMEDANGWLVH